MANMKPDRVAVTLLLNPADRDLLQGLCEMTKLEMPEVVARAAFAWQIALMAAHMPVGSGIDVDLQMPDGIVHYRTGSRPIDR